MAMGRRQARASGMTTACSGAQCDMTSSGLIHRTSTPLLRRASVASTHLNRPSLSIGPFSSSTAVTPKTPGWTHKREMSPKRRSACGGRHESVATPNTK